MSRFVCVIVRVESSLEFTIWSTVSTVIGARTGKGAHVYVVNGAWRKIQAPGEEGSFVLDGGNVASGTSYPYLGNLSDFVGIELIGMCLFLATPTLPRTSNSHVLTIVPRSIAEE